MMSRNFGNGNACRMSTGIFFAGGLPSALGRTSFSRPWTQLGDSRMELTIHFDKVIGITEYIGGNEL